MAFSGSQKLRAQDSVPVRRCDTKRRTGTQGREEENGDGDRAVNEDWDEDRYDIGAGTGAAMGTRD